ncbi:uncharacterized protein LOC116117754 [Pistacia vera]|uniref:uncharacterized protein LOC116117754 n=1 Tax=Pistacia vera TaxID=55513 RepID=UPI001263B96A|nr:uncharacterized protein LOC116117754 [Pistacia vera]
MLLTEIDHFSHSHRLKLMPVEAPYQCDGCKELGFAPCYQCTMCSFHLHEECARAEPNISHKYFKKCNFKFYEENLRGGVRICDACGKDIQGFLYQCSHEKAFDLHPCCAKLKETLTGPEGIKLYLSNKVQLKCLKCQRKKTSNRVKGFSYVSSSGKYCYHVACVKDLIVDNWRRAHFSGITEVNGHLALQNIAVPSQEVALLSGQSSMLRKAKTFCKKALLYIRLVVSAIFGNPTDLIFAILEPLLSNN